MKRPFIEFASAAPFPTTVLAHQSPSRLPNGIRSSYELTHNPDCTNSDPHEYAVVREIAVPDYVVIDDKTRTMRVVYL